MTIKKTRNTFVLLAGFLLWGMVGMSPAEANGTLRNGFPGRRVSGGMRCPCICAENFDGSLVTIMPRDNLISTASAAPVLLVYLPQAVSESAVMVQIHDNNRQIVWEGTAVANSVDGIARFDLSEALNSIEVTSPVEFSVHAICGQGPNSTMALSTRGFIERTEPSVAVSQLLSSVPSLESVEALLEANHWMDAMFMLDELRRAHPEDSEIQAHWQLLLEGVNLPMIMDAPTIDRPLLSR